jgi:hypothetical protein
MRLRRVDPIQQGTGDALLVFGDDCMRAGTGFFGITIIPTGAGIHTIEHLFHA